MHGSGYNEKCDIWSCGIILYMMIAGSPPFYSIKKEEVINMIKKGVVEYTGIFVCFYKILAPIWGTVSKHCLNLLKGMLDYDPEKRISASQALSLKYLRKYSEGSDACNADLRISIQNLRNFRTQTKFQKAVLIYCASQKLSQKAEAKIRKLFDIFDTNRDGKLTTEELMFGYKNVYGDTKKAKKEVERIMKNINFNHSGVIEYNGIFILIF
jgi:calcium-dependent protein kinase